MLFAKTIQKGANVVLDRAGNIISNLAEQGVESGIKYNVAEAVATKAEQVGTNAARAEAKAAAKKNKAAESALTFIGEEEEKISSGIGKSTIGGAAIGAISGAGIGGVTGLATGADEDDMKSMVLMGALAGGTAGAITGGVSKAIKNHKATKSFFKDSNALDVVSDVATGKANHAVKGGAKGVLSKAGASLQSFGDKVDNIGGSVSRGVTNKAVAKEFGYDLNEVRDVIRNDLVDEAIENVAGKANLLGGAAQGAIMGSASGAVIGGISGAIDEDDTALSGALRGGLIGGTLGGIGGGASGYFNKSGKVLSNTTNNLKSLVGGN